MSNAENARSRPGVMRSEINASHQLAFLLMKIWLPSIGKIMQIDIGYFSGIEEAFYKITTSKVYHWPVLREAASSTCENQTSKLKRSVMYYKSNNTIAYKIKMYRNSNSAWAATSQKVNHSPSLCASNECQLASSLNKISNQSPPPLERNRYAIMICGENNRA